MANDILLAETYVAQCEEIAAAEANLERLKAEKAALEYQVLDVFQHNGGESLRIPTHTVYLQRTVVAGPNGDERRATGMLMQEGLDKHVKPTIIHASTLGKHLDEHPTLLRRLGGTVRITELFHARVRRK